MRLLSVHVIECLWFLQAPTALATHPLCSFDAFSKPSRTLMLRSANSAKQPENGRAPVGASSGRCRVQC